MNRMFFLFAFASLFTTSTAFAFSFDFDWQGLRSCTNGNANMVSNPAFVLSDVPEGTAVIEFRMVDLDVPDFSHGGGTVAWTNETIVPLDSFTYLSPCPPNGSHRYEWTARAKTKKSGGKVLAKFRMTKTYP